MRLCTFPCATSAKKVFFKAPLLDASVLSGKLYKKFLNFFFFFFPLRENDFFLSPGYKLCYKIWLIVLTLKAIVFQVDWEDFRPQEEQFTR